MRNFKYMSPSAQALFKKQRKLMRPGFVYFDGVYLKGSCYREEFAAVRQNVKQAN